VKATLLFLILAVCISCSSNKANKGMKISVQMDVFSGRPNPSWELSPSESGELLKQLSLLTEVDKNNAAFHDNLGYRGFIISFQEDDATKPPPDIYRVYKGFVLMNGKVYSDNSSVEKKLIKQAITKGFADIIDALQIRE
jgi:hypothetical protein